MALALYVSMIQALKTNATQLHRGRAALIGFYQQRAKRFFISFLMNLF